MVYQKHFQRAEEPELLTYHGAPIFGQSILELTLALCSGGAILVDEKTNKEISTPLYETNLMSILTTLHCAIIEI